MLENYNLDIKINKEEYKIALNALKPRLALLQQKLKQLKIPVIILFEGWGASGKGNMISNLIQELDPRGFKVYTIGEPTSDELRFPMMHRFWKKVPEYGQIAVFDRSWYRNISISVVESCLSKVVVDQYFNEILDFESQLCDDGYIIIKFFLHISKQEQKERLEALDQKKATRWRVTDNDWKHNKDYNLYYNAFTEMIERTDNEKAPWTIVEAHDRKYAIHKVYMTVINALEMAVSKKDIIQTHLDTTSIRVNKKIRPLPAQKLSEVDLNKSIDEETYKSSLKEGQNRLFELHNKLYKKKVPLIIAYEGWDAAGKGGNIKRITRGLDPRGFEVIPISSPTPTEINHQYLWRFWNSLPKNGHIAIYDRTWYGRVMVERLEGFCTEQEWHRAFDEINHFEDSLKKWGAIIIKFWLHIDKDEQLIRFTERQNTLEKQWKITEDDWRNRNRWDDYENAVDEMIQCTNTEYAPWIIVESNDKKFARIKTIYEVISTIEKNI